MSRLDRKSLSFAAIVLAAGRSSRMGDRNKLLTEIAGTPIVRRTVDVALRTQARSVIVVTGHEAQAVSSVLQDCSVKIVYNPNFAEGLSTSLRTGLSAVSPEINAAAVLLGDMPFIEAELIDRLALALTDTDASIAVPTFGGKRGNPVMWSRKWFDELQGIQGDIGARNLISRNEKCVFEVPSPDSGILVDLDTEEDLAPHRR